MKALVCILLLLETVVQQQVDGGLNEIEISSEDARQNPPQTETLRAEASTDSQQYSHLCFSDIHTALRELTASVTEQKAIIRALETRLTDAEKAAEQQMFLLEELDKKNEELLNLTQSQVEELRKEHRDREIAFSASLVQSGSGDFGPFTTPITIIYRNVLTNVGNAYNPITGIFTAPVKGVYMFKFSVYAPTQSNPAGAYIMKNGKHAIIAYAQQSQGTLNSSKGVVLILEVGDVVYVSLWTGGKVQDNTNNHNTFSGYILFPLR